MKKIEEKLVDKINIKELTAARNTVAIEHAVRSRGRFLRNYLSALGMSALLAGSVITGSIWAFGQGLVHTTAQSVVVGGYTYTAAGWTGLNATGQAMASLFIIFSAMLTMGFILWILVNKHEQNRAELELAMDEVEDDLVMLHLHNEITEVKTELKAHKATQ